MHEPVLLKEILEILAPKPGEFMIDGTLDGGGHAKEVLSRIGESGTFLGIDLDKTMTEKFKTDSKAKLILINDNFKNIPMILKENKLGKADGLLLDLGFSSEQLDKSGRGFS